MEYGMDTPSFREFKAGGHCPCFSDFKWPMASWGKLRFRVCSLDVCSFQEHKVVFFETVSGRVRSGLFHYFRGHFQGCGDFLSQLVQCAKAFFEDQDRGGELEWGNELGLVSVPDFKRGVPGGTMGSYVVRELCERQQFRPIILLIIAEDPEVLF
jgi:hypothetical protein